MHLGYAARALRSRAAVVLLLTVLGLAASCAYYFNAQTYTTSAHLLYTTPEALAGLRAPAPERFVKTEATKLYAETVLERVAVAQTDGSSATDIRKAMTVTGGTDQDVIEVAIAGATPEQSRARVEALVLSAARARVSAGVTVRDLWIGPTEPMLSKTVIAAGAVGGLVAGALLVLVWAAVRRPVLSPDFVDVQGVTAYPAVLDRTAGSPAEQARRVLEWIDLRGRCRDDHTVLVSDTVSDQVSSSFSAALRSQQMPGITVATTEAAPAGTDGREIAPIASRAGGYRTALFITRCTSSTEHEIERRLRAYDFAVDDAVLVLLRPRK